jgi:pyruvate kinase
LRAIVGPDVKIIAKIESAVAINVVDEIIRESDGIMIARGDLGIEMPLEELPILQKELVRHAHWHGKPAIVATQMMMSMVEKSHPTYAEVTDVANAVMDGADVLMLSDETAVGNYPLECVQTMKKIVDKTDEYFNKTNYWH